MSRGSCRIVSWYRSVMIPNRIIGIGIGQNYSPHATARPLTD